MIFLVGGLMEAPLQAKNFDSDALETQKADIFSELYDLSKTTSFINEYIYFYNGDNFHQEL